MLTKRATPNIDFTTFPHDYATTALETAFYQSLGSLFDAGEGFFCRSLQAYRADLPHLKELINDFCHQEVNHSRMHSKLAGMSKRAEWWQKVIDKPLRLATNRLPRSGNLQITVILEHLTASLADVLLHDRKLQERLIGDAKVGWLYHCCEEVEHQQVAITVAIESGCPVLLRQALTPFVYAALFAVLSAAFVDLAWERKSLRGVVGLGYVLREMLLQVDYVAPMTRSWHPS